MKYLILDDLESTAARLPDKIAFGDENTSATFAELVALSRAVGSALIGHKKGDHVETTGPTGRKIEMDILKIEH